MPETGLSRKALVIPGHERGDFLRRTKPGAVVTPRRQTVHSEIRKEPRQNECYLSRLTGQQLEFTTQRAEKLLVKRPFDGRAAIRTRGKHAGWHAGHRQ